MSRAEGGKEHASKSLTTLPPSRIICSPCQSVIENIFEESSILTYNLSTSMVYKNVGTNSLQQGFIDTFECGWPKFPRAFGCFSVKQ